VTEDVWAWTAEEGCGTLYFFEGFGAVDCPSASAGSSPEVTAPPELLTFILGTDGPVADAGDG
jgi:hypothetical protein